MTSKTIDKTKNMITFPRLGIYLIAWLLLIFITALTSQEIFIKIDRFVYSTYYSGETNAQFQDKIILIDLPRGDLNLEEYRIETSKLLSTINSMVTSQFKSSSNNNILRKPNVILDLSYGSSNDGIETLRKSVEQLKSNGINVYGAYTLPEDDEKIFFDTYDIDKNKTLYDSVFVGGRLHTNYNRNGCIISYNSYKDIPRDTLGNMIRIESLIVRVAKDNSGIAETNFDELKNKAVPIDSIVEIFTPRTYQFTNSLNANNGIFKKFDETINFNGTFVIIGRFAVDIKDICDKSIPGPFLLASGLLNELQPVGDKKVTNEAYSDVPIQLGMAFLFGLLASVFFALIYKYLEYLQTKPLLIAFISFSIGVLLLIGLGFAFLRIGFVIRPTLPAVSMFWASFLAWRFAKKFLVTGLIKGSGKYDIFISYSFSNSDWVKKHLYYPLCELKKSDGSKLEIFFAEKNIRIGELFVSKYMKAIVNSKLFIPVMTEEYYKKNHCKNEMDLALNRKIGEFMKICILNFKQEYIPAEFGNILNIPAEQENLANKIIQDVLENTQEENQDEQKQIDKQEAIKPMELDHQEQKPTDKSDSIEAVNLEQQEAEPSEKDEIEIFDNLDSDKKDKKAKKKDKKSDKKEKKEKNKKKPKKEEKEKAKKKDKKAEKKSDKKDKKDKKEKEKKTKKSSDKKDKKVKDKKTKKSSDKKSKKGKSKKGKKS